MKKIVKKVAIFSSILLIGIQFIPANKNQREMDAKTDFLSLYKAPKNMVKKIKSSCYDCHSNNTHYPWYSNIQPGAWFMEHHINEGKKELNFSEFGNYSKRRKKAKLKSIISQIEDDKMPLWSYTLIHQNAKISEGEKQQLINWFTKVRDGLN